MGLSESKMHKYIQTSPSLMDSISRQTKSKYLKTDYSEMERNNMYVRTPSKLKLPAKIPIFRQRRPPIPVRSDSTRSTGCSTRSDQSSIDFLFSSKSISDLETTYLNQTSLPLQSVREDECLEINEQSKNERLLIDMLKEKFSSPGMSKLNSSHQGLSTTVDDDDQPGGDLHRDHRLRSSLPFIVKPAGKSNSLGLCFLICGNETKKVLLPAYISCLDTLKALFVRAFPQYLTMKQMDTENIRIYIRENGKEIFYQLEDMNDVKDRSVLKLVYLNSNSKPHVSFKQPEIHDERLNNGLSNNFCSGLKSILSSPRNDDDDDDDSSDPRRKLFFMEKQLKSLTQLVQDLTRSTSNHSLYEQIKDLKTKIHLLRQELLIIRQMQQSFKDNIQIEFEQANKNIQKQFQQFNHNEFEIYIKSREKLDQDLEDLEISVEELQNDVKTKHCYVTMNDVESFALVLSTISRSLVDLKTSFPNLCEQFSSSNQQSIKKFLNEEPECLDFTIKKCKRLTTMLYHLKRLSMNQENRSPKPIEIVIRENFIDRKYLLEEIRSVTSNSDERMKAIERAEKLRERRLIYENQLDMLKQGKSTSDQTDGYFENRSLTNSISTRTSVCSTDSNNCPSPSLSSLTRQTNDCKSRLKLPSKVTFSQQVITNEKSSTTNKSKANLLPPRTSTAPPLSSSSAVSSASSSSTSSSCIGGNGASRFCGIIPLLSIDRRHNGRCYSLSSSSTDTDSVISNSQKSPKIINPKYHQTPLMRASVTDL